jgi:hypothetical protein
MPELPRQSSGGGRVQTLARFQLVEGSTRLRIEWDPDARELTIDLEVPPPGVAEEPGYSVTLSADEADALQHWLNRQHVEVKPNG